MSQLPTLAELQTAADRLGMSPPEGYLAAAREAMASICGAYATLDDLTDDLPPVTYPRTVIQPSTADNRHNAWAVCTCLKGKADGPLKGKRIAVKDSICVAGVPMRNGGAMPDGYVPEVDATVVTRILDAGGEIAGKAACEFGCVSGSSHTGSTGPVHNPYRHGHSAGGSSSGSAVLVAAGDVDMALGADQGGSIRIPASYCGIYGLKPTFGLVPYTGIATVEASIDHCGPMTASVADNALLLEAIAGQDELDWRQRDVNAGSYTTALGERVEGLRIGVVKEGFSEKGSDPRIDAKVLAAAEKLTRLGASVEHVSIPWHLKGTAIWSPITHDGGFLSMWTCNGLGVGGNGLHVGSLAAAMAGWRQRPDEQADTVRIMMLFGLFSSEHNRGRYYAKAQNLRRSLRAAYDAALTRFDLLLMPTTPTTAPELPAEGCDLREQMRASWPMAANLCPFNASGHPAMSLPCGMVDELPVGMMLVASRWNEAAIYRAAFAFAASYDWKRL